MPIEEQIEALEWLHAQNHVLLPRCFFSGRRAAVDSEMCFIDHTTKRNGTSHSSSKVVSVAGVGSAVFFTHLRPFSFDDWRAIRRLFYSNSLLSISAFFAFCFHLKYAHLFWFALLFLSVNMTRIERADEVSVAKEKNMKQLGEKKSFLSVNIKGG